MSFEYRNVTFYIRQEASFVAKFGLLSAPAAEPDRIALMSVIVFVCCSTFR